MSVQVGTVDGLINITPVIKDCFVKAIESFALEVVKSNKLGELSIGDAFQRYTYPVYSKLETKFDLKSLEKEVTTKTGKKQSPAYVTYCKKMGLLETDGSKLFQLTPVGQALNAGEIDLHEYALLYMSKQGIFIDGQYKENLLVHVANIFKVSSSVTTDELLLSIATKYGDSDFQKTRSDIILGALCTAKILCKINNTYVLAGIEQAQILDLFAENGKHISPALLDTNPQYADYVGTFKYGLYDFLNEKNLSSFAYLYPNLMNHLQGNYTIGSSSLPLQQIYYGAPGTGKSHGVKEVTDKVASELVFRTTFHPDSDYSTFVGAYKPTMKQLPIYNQQTGAQIGVEDKIVYSFVPQAFLKAYVAAWKNQGQPVFLVIEEINRGNCAQIFGDIFQLLDRKDNGESKYPIKADQDIKDYLAKEFADCDNLAENIQSGEELLLPAKLHIWATMNTSDQSLFPIDSAFKRRWDWKYVPIQDGGKKWGIKVAGLEYDWWSFLREINDLIDSTTNSEDKKLGYFFCKPDEGECITADRFVNKVIFYLWNDVFKDYDISREAFKDENKRLAFGKFFNNDGSANEGVVDDFLTKLGVAKKSSNTEAQTGNGESTPELEEVYKEYWKRFEPYAKNKGYTFKAGAPYSHTYAYDNVTYIVELPHGNGKNDWTKMLKLAVQMGPMEQGKLEDMKKSLPNGFMIDYNGYGSRLERRFDNVNKENLAVSANDVIFELLINELKNMINIIETNNPSSAQ